MAPVRHQHLGEPRDDRVRGGTDVPYGPRPAAQRPRDGEHGRPGIPPGPGGDADDTPPVLVALGARHGQQPCHVGVLEGLKIGFGGEFGVEADVDEPYGTGVLARGIDEQPGLVGAEGDGDVGAHGGAAHLAAVRLDPAGQVDGDDERPGVRRERREPGGVGP